MKIITSVIFTSLFLTGCFSEAPKCSDAEVKETLKSVYLQVLDNINSSNNMFLAGFASSLPKAIESIDSIRTVAYDEKIELRQCKADVRFDNNQTASISYSVQVNEENSDEFYVELDTEFVEGLMQSNMMNGFFNK